MQKERRTAVHNLARSKNPAYELIDPKGIDISACRQRDNPLSNATGAARTTPVLKQCNELDYAPRDRMCRTNVAQ